MALAFWKRKRTEVNTPVQPSPKPPLFNFNEVGVVYPYQPTHQTDTDFYWQSLAQEDIADLVGTEYVLSWAELFKVIDDPEHQSALYLFNLPALSSLHPMICSQGALSDSDFQISVSGWCDQSGQIRSNSITRTGAVLLVDGQQQLLPSNIWSLIENIRAFSRLGNAKTRQDNQQYWSKIRRLAKHANARMDDFLQKTIVLAPETLQLNMRRNTLLNDAVVEIQPAFEDAPKTWLQTFDQYVQVQDQYSITLPEGGIAHVVIAPEIKSVLNEIKKMPNRRVTGERAQTFLHNPYAQLGEDAVKVVSPESFEKSRQDADIFSYDLTVEMHFDAEGYFSSADLQLDERSERNAPPVILELRNPEHAYHLLEAYRKAQGSLYWVGYEIVLSAPTHKQLDQLRHEVDRLNAAINAAKVAEVLDLSNYSDRVVDIGAPPNLNSEFIKRDSGESGWLPERLIDAMFDRISPHISTEFIQAIDQAIRAAEVHQQEQVQLPHLDQPISMVEARALQDRVNRHNINCPDSKARDTTTTEDSPIGLDKPERAVLIIDANIDGIDYSSQRAQTLEFDFDRPPVARLPSAFRREEFSLKKHQHTGVAWLQNLHRFAPDQLSGCLLADDMGLGKTLQLLCFIGEYLESAQEKKPVLIVAPVSLLENWRAEANRFFSTRLGHILSLYGDELKFRRIQKAQIPKDLQELGICNLLEEGWRGDADIVLTTYETLRDLEFSLAREHWSIMICDEAQKIKVPSTLVTQAAKAQKADFKIACTGTPVENSLTDLWCLFDFIQAGLLGSLNEFGRKYRRPIEKNDQADESAIDELRQLIEPQILRRMKHDVADLPAKIEAVDCKTLTISPLQQQLYANVVAEYRHVGDADRAKAILGALHKMRMICAHPLQLQPSAADRESPKVAWLLQTLKHIQHKQEKVIIFTEFREIQAFLQRVVGQAFGLQVSTVNGDTSANSSKSGITRQRLIDQFQQKAGFNVIILSTTAVGFGVNVQKANHVIHYTRCWNPAKEDQATDRAYRIGQEKEVIVYYPSIYSEQFDTFEIKLDRLLNAKRQLAGDMLNGTPEISANELAAEVFQQA